MALNNSQTAAILYSLVSFPSSIAIINANETSRFWASKDGVVLSMADEVMLGNGERFQARGVGDECWEGRGLD